MIVTDTADFEGDLSGFGLSSSGETVWFENASGTVIDNYAFWQWILHNPLVESLMVVQTGCYQIR